MILRKAIGNFSLLFACNKYSIISHKFYFGQGGELQIDLTKRSYSISIETVWEDYSLVQIEGLTGVQNFTLRQEEGVSYFKDDELQENLSQKIDVSLKIPEDYTLRGIIQGSINHKASAVGKTMRSKPFELQVTGADHQLNLGDVRAEQVKLMNSKGSISVPSLTVQVGRISSKLFSSKKLMTSNSIEINSNSVELRSMIMFGKSRGTINCSNLYIQSISGASQITSSNELKIERYYGGQDNIDIKCNQIKDKLGIQTGTGRVQFESQQLAIENGDRVVLGKMHKGHLRRKGNLIQIC